MAEIRYDVPLIAQTKSMSCWYAAAAMIAQAYKPGTRYMSPPVFGTWHRNTGLDPDHVMAFAREEGLKLLPSAFDEFTPSSLIATLSRNGPIWAGGDWFGRPGQGGKWLHFWHVIVITGADDRGNVFFNDPDGGVAKVGQISWLNERRYWGLMLMRGRPLAL